VLPPIGRSSQLALYSMYLRDGTEQLIDARPQEFASIELLRLAMVAAAQNLVNRDAGEGRLDLRFRIDAEDASRSIVCSVRLEHSDHETQSKVVA